MVTQMIEAVYENGNFRPTVPMDIDLAEGQRVRLAIEQVDDPDAILCLAAQVYEGLNPRQIDSIEQHSRRRENFFGERPSV